MIIGFDLSTHLCGWCAGDGSTIPTADAFRLQEQRDLGLLGCNFQQQVLSLHARFPASVWALEKALLMPHDNLYTLERQYGLAMILMVLARKLGITCRRYGVAEVKKEFAGKNATKPEMVAMAVKLGIALPRRANEGREDAADAAGVWRLGVRDFAKQHIQRWDAAIYGSRGALL